MTGRCLDKKKSVLGARLNNNKDYIMTDIKIKSKTALLGNVVSFLSLMDRLMSRPDKLPGIGVFHGYSGLGKTESAIYGANKHQAYYVRLGDSWTKKKFCDAILMQLSEYKTGSIADKVDKITEVLRMESRPLLIDEADYAFSKNYFEIIREIYDESQTPIILLGEERLPQKIQQHERFHNRIMEWAQAQPCNFEDARKLADIYAGDVRIEDDLLEVVLKKTSGTARRVAVMTNYIQEQSYADGVDGYSLKSWGNKPFMSFSAKAARK